LQTWVPSSYMAENVARERAGKQGTGLLCLRSGSAYIRLFRELVSSPVVLGRAIGALIYQMSTI